MVPQKVAPVSFVESEFPGVVKVFHRRCVCPQPGSFGMEDLLKAPFPEFPLCSECPADFFLHLGYLIVRVHGIMQLPDAVLVIAQGDDLPGGFLVHFRFEVVHREKGHQPEGVGIEPLGVDAPVEGHVPLVV